MFIMSKIRFAAADLLITYKMSVEILMQNVEGGVMLHQLCTLIALY